MCNYVYYITRVVRIADVEAAKRAVEIVKELMKLHLHGVYVHLQGNRIVVEAPSYEHEFAERVRKNIEAAYTAILVERVLQSMGFLTHLSFSLDSEQRLVASITAQRSDGAIATATITAESVFMDTANMGPHCVALAHELAQSLQSQGIEASIESMQLKEEAGYQTQVQEIAIDHQTLYYSM